MVLETKYYETLKVLETASTEEISKAYKKIALTCHPDKTGRDPVLTERFKDITRAYEVLKDGESRRVYDQYGEAGIEGVMTDSQQQQQQQQQQQRQQRQNQNTCHIRRATDLFSQVFNDFHDAFNGAGVGSFPMNMHMNMMNMMGRLSQNFAQTQTQTQTQTHLQTLFTKVTPVSNPSIREPVRGHDIHHVCSVTLWEMYHGKVVKFRLPKNSKCKTCLGVGGFNPKLCGTCAGQGQVLITVFSQNSQFQELSLCKECSGSGVYIAPNDLCLAANCRRGYVKESKIIKANIFPGSKHNDKIILQGEGDEGRNIFPGDVIIHLKEVPDSKIVRKFNDLFIEHDIDLKTALCGGKTVIKDFMKAGQSLEINVNVHGYEDLNLKDVQQGEVLGIINSNVPKIVKGFGMPINEASVDGTYYQNSDEIEDFVDVVFDLKRYKKGNLFIKFNVTMPRLEDFAAGIEDFRLLEKVLPNKSEMSSAQQTFLSGNLSKIPNIEQFCPQAAAEAAATAASTNKVLEDYCPLNKRLKKSASFAAADQKKEKYDYNDIELEESEEEEVEDERFYSSEWDDRKRKANMNGLSDFVTT